MITRRIPTDVRISLTFSTVVTLVGSRKVGKKTLAKLIMSDSAKPPIYLDLEKQSDLFKLNDAELFLSQHAGNLIVIDEVQNKKSFYRTHQGTEVDLVFTRGLTVVATAEIKYTNSPQLSKGNFLAFDDLNAPMNYVITPSSDDYLFKERIRICSLKAFIFNYLPAF